MRNSRGHMVSIPHHSLQRRGGGRDGWGEHPSCGALMGRNEMWTLHYPTHTRTHTDTLSVWHRATVHQLRPPQIQLKGVFHP